MQGKPRLAACLACAATLALAAACTPLSVTMEWPLSEPTAATDADRRLLEGTWLVDLGPYYLQEEYLSVYTIRFGKDGVGRIGSSEWDREKGVYRLVEGEVILTPQSRTFVPESDPSSRAFGKTTLRRDSHDQFMSIRFREPNGEWQKGYALVQYQLQGLGILVVWPPDVLAFERLIQSGRLRGELTRSRAMFLNTDIVAAHFTSPPEAILEQLNLWNVRERWLFRFEFPIVLRRLDRLLLFGRPPEDPEAQ